jgi:hypothetical protein
MTVLLRGGVRRTFGLGLDPYCQAGNQGKDVNNQGKDVNSAVALNPAFSFALWLKRSSATCEY